MNIELIPLTDEFRQDYYNFCKKEAAFPFLFDDATFSHLWEKVKDPSERHFIIKADGEKCGFCEFRMNAAPDPKEADLGIEIFPEKRRHGIALKAVKLLMEEAGREGCERLTWRTTADNKASIGLAEALGGALELTETVNTGDIIEGTDAEITFLTYRLR